MSKKESEFDRYERMKKLQKEAEAQKKKQSGNFIKKNKPKISNKSSQKHRLQSYMIDLDEDYYEYYK